MYQVNHRFCLTLLFVDWISNKYTKIWKTGTKVTIPEWSDKKKICWFLVSAVQATGVHCFHTDQFYCHFEKKEKSILILKSKKISLCYSPLRPYAKIKMDSLPFKTFGQRNYGLFFTLIIQHKTGFFSLIYNNMCMLNKQYLMSEKKKSIGIKTTKWIILITKETNLKK